MRLQRTKKEWMDLRDRYYEAQTTPREERELAEYLFEDEESQTPEWDADRAVLSYALTGRSNAVKRQKHSGRRSWIAAAAVVGVAMAGYGLMTMNANGKCWMTQDGNTYYSEQMASEQMEENLLLALAEYSTVEEDLSMILTIE